MSTKPYFTELFPDPAASIEQTSPASGLYNCIAWAVENTFRFFWPDKNKHHFWPKHLPRAETLDAFALFFETFGYKICENTELEEGFQKVVIFVKNGLPSHAARQLPDGFWTSKIGALENVRHTLNAISGGYYGEVALVMKKHKQL